MFPMRKRWRLGQNNVSVCAAESERVHPGESFAIRFREGFDLCRDAQLQFFEIDVRTRRGEMQTRGNLAALKNQHCLHQSGDTGRGFAAP